MKRLIRIVKLMRKERVSLRILLTTAINAVERELETAEELDNRYLDRHVLESEYNGG